MITTFIGLAATQFVGREAILATGSGGNLALVLLAEHLGCRPGTVDGAMVLAFAAAMALTTILAVVAGLTVATSGGNRPRRLRQRHQTSHGG